MGGMATNKDGLTAFCSSCGRRTTPLGVEMEGIRIQHVDALAPGTMVAGKMGLPEPCVQLTPWKKASDE